MVRTERCRAAFSSSGSWRRSLSQKEPRRDQRPSTCGPSRSRCLSRDREMSNKAAVLHQSQVALLQIPGGHVELLIDFGVVVVHLTQQVHLLVQVLVNQGGKGPGIHFIGQLLLVGGVHLLQGLLQLMVPVQEGFPKLRCQVEICQNTGKHAHGESCLRLHARETWHTGVCAEKSSQKLSAVHHPVWRNVSYILPVVCVCVRARACVDTLFDESPSSK
ncbi:hypothetical protein EYF80_004120 [Liparis tanakae]|uniref:Uncharacterized protein n=1 Tax=Liparis tanakae TaxID=230148 RepID=A0A4Z2J643_9TELE|nr:hypothetical protein EYF80_004120 [Liparis tanakae]